MDKTMMDMMWVLLCSALVFTMQAGFCCVESGLTRAKHSINVAIKNLTDFGISVLFFWALGFGLMFGASFGGWFGASDFLKKIVVSNFWDATFFLFQVMFASTSVTIISGAVAERMRFASYLIVASLVAGLVYPIFGHWAWGGAEVGRTAGWLNLRGFVDFAGSSVVHSVGGWVSLAALLIIGARQGRFPPDGPPKKIQGNSIPLAVLGVMLLWFGWFGFNGGSTLAMNERVGIVLVNTFLAGASGMIAALLIGWLLRGFPDVVLPMNGSLAGLVAITANCHAVSAASALVIGACGAVAMLMTEDLLERFHIDDAVGAVGVHLGAGIWGTLAVALFGKPELLGTGLGRMAQLQVQLLGITACFLWAFGLSYALLYLIDRFFPLRVTGEEEHSGLNVSEHRATTELLDLFAVMNEQAKTKDMSLRVPVEPFTEVGQIAKRYNQVLDAFQSTVARTDAVIRAAKEGIITFLKDGFQVTSMNPSVQLMFGYAPPEAVGRPVTLFFKRDHEEPGKLETQLIEGARTNEPQKIMGQRANGSFFPLELSVSETRSGDETFYTAVCRDVTEYERYRENLQKRTRELEQLNRRLEDTKTAMLNVLEDFKEEKLKLEKAHAELKAAQAHLIEAEKSATVAQLAAGAAHEVKNPLAILLQGVDYLASHTVNDADPNVPSVLKDMEEAVARADYTVKGLLDLARPEKLTLVPENLNAVVEQAFFLVKYYLERRHARLIKELGTEIPPISADKSKIVQVFINLLVNAADAMPEGGTITVRTYAKLLTAPGGHVGRRSGDIFSVGQQVAAAEVEDTGTGVPPDVLPKIFDPFFTTKRGKGGTGLGLAVVKNIVEVHGGTISIRNKEGGRGARAVLMFPAGPAAPRK